ncbi:MAG: TolC family protein [Rhodothermales bacterium]|nr:TolC family protein [Rhodothermales bacterium]MBO6778888.1 TolC family protein [Rhodothermales bacterium]
MNRLLLLLAVSALAWRPAGAQDTLTVGLGEALSRALEVSPDILAEQAGLQFAEGRLGHARASRLLTDAGATTAHAFAPALDNPNSTATDRLYLDPDVRNDWERLHPFSRLDVDVIQPLWTWGQIGRSIDAARAGVELEQAAVQESQYVVVERTGELYFSMLLLNVLDRLASEAGDAVSRAKEEVEKQLEAGSADVGDADLFQVLITEQEVRKRVARVREEMATARSGLTRQLMLPPGIALETEDRYLEPLGFQLDALEVYEQLALRHRPEVAQAQAGVEAREALVDVARSDYFPKLFLGAHMHYSGTTADRFRQRNPYVGDSFLSRSLEAGLGMRLQLNFRQTRARVEQARANLAEVQHLETGARELVLFEVEQAWRAVRIRQEELAAAEEAFRLSREWLLTEYNNFELELGDTDDLIKAVQAKLELEAGRHQAVFDLNMAILRLHTSSGLLEPLLAY